jgi:hypothetical protein
MIMQRLQHLVALVALVVAPLVVAIGASIAAVMAFGDGQVGLGIAATGISVLSGVAWLLLIPAWFLALKG